MRSNHWFKILSLTILLSNGLLAMTQDEQPVEPSAEVGAEKVLLIPLSDDGKYMVDQVQSEFIIEAIDRAEEEGYTRIILEIDTFGGMVFSAREINERLLRAKVPITAYIKTKAISAGVFIAWACDEIVMQELTTMGDAQVIMQTPQGIEAAPEKAVSVYRDDWEKASKKRNRSYALARGFFDIDLEILQVGTVDDFSFMTRRDFDRLDEDKQPPILKVVVEKGELLTMHAEEAAEYGLVTVATDFESWLASRNIETTDISNMDMNMNQDILRYLGANRWLFLLLTLVGLNGLYMELKAPGFGIPGLTAIVCFTIVFGSRYFLGTANGFEILLFAIGLVLCMVEIFVLPGFGVAGIAGMGCVFGALVLASLPDMGGLPSQQWQWDMIAGAAWPIAAAFALSIVTFMFVAPIFFKIPITQRHMLPNEMTAEEGFVADAVPDKDIVGVVGRAMGHLRPTGRMELADGRFLDVVSDGEYVNDGAAIEVSQIDGNRIVVRPVA